MKKAKLIQRLTESLKGEGTFYLKGIKHIVKTRNGLILEIKRKSRLHNAEIIFNLPKNAEPDIQAKIPAFRDAVLWAMVSQKPMVFPSLELNYVEEADSEVVVNFNNQDESLPLVLSVVWL